MALVGVESVGDLHSDPLSSPILRYPVVHRHVTVYWELYCCHIRVAFKEHQRYIIPHETMIHDAFAGLGWDWLQMDAADAL
jgi:hypothetical protein